MNVREAVTPRRRWLVVLSLPLVLAACGPEEEDDEPSYTIEDRPLSGTINGEPWELEYGTTDDFLSDDEELFTKLLGIPPPEGEPVCDAFVVEEGSHILITLPRAPGEYEMSLRQNGTFAFNESENNVATDGLIRIDEVTDTEITGGLAMEFGNGDDFVVNGTFSATICPE